MKEIETEKLVEMFLSEPGIESSNIDFKHKAILDGGKKDLAKIISALTNTQGGAIIIGVSKDDNTSNYQEFGKHDEAELDIHNVVRDNTYPSMEDRIEVSYPVIKGNRILRIDIEKGYRNIVYFNGKNGWTAWRRSGSGTTKMNEEEKKKWKETRFSDSGHDLTKSEEIVKKSGAYSRGGYNFKEVEELPKYEDQPDYYFLEKHHSRNFTNTIFHLPDNLLFGYWFKAMQLDIDHNNYEDFLRGFAEVFPMREDAAFSIAQEEGNWAGYGVREFINCINDMNQRYEKYRKEHKAHNRELAILTAETRFGRVTIYFYYQITQEVPVFRYARMYLSTEGIPYNTYPLSVFLEAFGSELKEGSEAPAIETNGTGYGIDHNGNPNGPKLEIKDALKYPSNSGIAAELNDTVSRVVFKNPFYHQKEQAINHFSNGKFLEDITCFKHLIGKVKGYPVNNVENFNFYLDSITVYDTGKISGGQSITLDVDIEAESI